MFFRIILLSVYLVFASTAHAETVKIMISAMPGTIMDHMSRALVDILENETGDTYVFEYKNGAGGQLAASQVSSDMTNRPVIMLSNISNLVLQQLTKDITYNLKPVAYIGTTSLILVSAKDSKFKTIEDIIKHTKNYKPTVSSGAIGSSAHVSAEIFFNKISVDMLGITYKTAGSAMPDLMAGRLDLSLAYWQSVAGLIQQGQLNGIAVFGPRRFASFPDVPTLDEKNLKDGYSLVKYALFASPGTDAALVKKIQTTLNKAFSNPAVVAKWLDTLSVDVNPTKVLQTQLTLDSEFKIYRSLMAQKPELFKPN